MVRARTLNIISSPRGGGHCSSQDRGAHAVRAGPFRQGEARQQTRRLSGVASSSRPPPVMMAAVMRPGTRRSMVNIINLHHALGDANDATLRETAKQLLKLTSHRQCRDESSKAKAIRANVPKITSLWATRLLERVFEDRSDPSAPSAGGAMYCIMFGGRPQQRALDALFEPYLPPLSSSSRSTGSRWEVSSRTTGWSS